MPDYIYREILNNVSTEEILNLHKAVMNVFSKVSTHNTISVTVNVIKEMLKQERDFALISLCHKINITNPIVNLLW